MAWAAVGAAAVTVVGSSLLAKGQSSAASDASNVQQQSSADAIAEQRRQYDQTRTDNAPYRDTGVAANSRLRYLLGLGGGGSIGGTVGGQPGSVDEMAKAILQQYPTWSATGIPGQPGSSKDIVDSFIKTAPEILSTGMAGGPTGGQYGKDNPTVQSLLQQAQNIPDGNQSGPGSLTGSGDLLRRFTMADRDADPVYQSGLKFGEDQGRDAINARAIANGGYDSGATLKALTRYGNDYGSTKANESYNRFTNDQTGIYNKLAGVSGTGQQATNQVTAAGQGMAANNSGLMTGAGNAASAGIVGGANAWGGALGGINSGINNYQSNQTLQALLARQNGAGLSSQYGYGNVYGAGGGGTVPTSVNWNGAY